MEIERYTARALAEWILVNTHRNVAQRSKSRGLDIRCFRVVHRSTAGIDQPATNNRCPYNQPCQLAAPAQDVSTHLR